MHNLANLNELSCKFHIINWTLLNQDIFGQLPYFLPQLDS